MRNETEVSELMKSGSDVWNFLKTRSGLDIKLYDASLVEELRSRLSLPPTGDFERLLEIENISTEDFVTAFFQTVQPYAEMMADLLRMFEKAGAKQTDKNLAILFKFDEDLPELSFDLSHFRDWLESWTRVIGKYLANVWNSNTLWALSSVLSEWDWGIRLRDPEAQRWVFEYMEQRVWPDFSLSAPHTGNSDLDQRLSRAWRVWARVVEESSKYGRDRDALREIAFGQPTDLPSDDLIDEQREDWSPTLLGRIDSDHWSGSFALGAYHKAETISALPPAERRQRARELQSRLDDVFERVPKVQIEGETLVRELQEFLKLPIWQRRHELYSAWISTQLLDALEGNSVRIHQIGGTLVFSFSGTHLATADAFDPKLHVWAELRSPLADPVGKSRKHAIQPDYSLITDPVTAPEASILEVECKQYRRPSARNFSAALTDYARGRPNAHVVLVNYGPANESILDRVDPSVRHRTSLIGRMRPRSKLAQERFKQIVHEAISRRYGPAAGIAAERTYTDLGNMRQISLLWHAVPRDLDLHLRISAAGKAYEIYYSQMGSITEEPWAQLDKDVQSGHGSETIEIARWMEGKYHFAVHNYSGDAPLADCGASITFAYGQRQWQFQCPCSDPLELDNYGSSSRISPRKGETQCQSVERLHRSSRPEWCSKSSPASRTKPRSAGNTD